MYASLPPSLRGEGDCDSATCYNSAYLTSSSSGCADDDAGGEALALTGAAVGGMLLGMLGMWLALRCPTRPEKSEKEGD